MLALVKGGGGLDVYWRRLLLLGGMESYQWSAEAGV